MELMLGDTRETAGATDLMNECATLDAQCEGYELYNVMTEDGNGFIIKTGEMMFIPSANRAGIMLGGDSQWTDAGSPQDAIDRHNNDEMAN